LVDSGQGNTVVGLGNVVECGNTRIEVEDEEGYNHGTLVEKTVE
jgi:hypothetical protein